jgi:alkylhydroperoxidase family enzyme
MPNIPYKNVQNYQPKELLDAVVARRGARGILNLDRMLLHSPPLTEGWGAFFKKMRGELIVDFKLRELASCATALLTGAHYEFNLHKPEWAKGGATPAQISALENVDTAAGDKTNFDDTERAVIKLAIEMTRNIQVKPETLEAIRAKMPGEQQIIELIATIAAMNMVGRLLAATGVELEKE